MAEPTGAAPGLNERVLNSVAWVSFQKWGSSIFGLITFAVLGRLLSPSEIGLAALALVFVTFFTMLADQGFSKAIVQKSSITDADCDSVFRSTLSIATGLSVLVLATSPAVASALHQPELWPILDGLTPVLILGAIAGVPEALLQRDFKFRSLALRTVLGNLAGGIVGITCAALGAGTWSLVVQALVTSTVTVIVVWRAVGWRPKLASRIRGSRALRSVGLRVLAIELIAIVNAQGDKLIVGAVLGPRDLGLYYVSNRIVSIIIDMQTSVIETVSLTTLSKLQAERLRLKRAFYRLTSLGAASGIAMFTVVAITAPTLVVTVFGDSWSSAAPIMRILCLMGCLNAIIVFDRNALIAAGRASSALVITATQCVVGLIFIAVGVQFGVLAVALAVVIRQYVVWPIRLTNLRNAIGISLRRYLLNWAGPMAAGLVIFGLGVLANIAWTPGPEVIERLGYLAVMTILGLGIYLPVLRITSRGAFADALHAGRYLLQLAARIRRQGGVRSAA